MLRIRLPGTWLTSVWVLLHEYGNLWKNDSTSYMGPRIYSKEWSQRRSQCHWNT